MTVEQLETLSLVSYILAGMFLAIAILLFWRLHIIQVISYLTGRTAKRAIAQIQAQNGNFNSVPAPNSNLDFRQSQSGGLISVTETLNEEAQRTETTLLQQESQIAETVLLRENSEAEETSLLSAHSVPINGSTNVGIRLKKDITFIHTNEVIQ